MHLWSTTHTRAKMDSSVPPVELDLEELVLSTGPQPIPGNDQAWEQQPATSLCGAMLIAVDPAAALLRPHEFAECVRALKRAVAGLAASEEEREAVWRFDCVSPDTGQPLAPLLMRVAVRIRCTLVIRDDADMWCFGRPGHSIATIVLNRKSSPGEAALRRYVMDAHTRTDQPGDASDVAVAVENARRDHIKAHGLGLPGVVDRMTIARLRQIAEALGTPRIGTKATKATLVQHLTQHIHGMLRGA